MNADDTEPFAFPDLPDAAVIALNEFLAAFYSHFQNHYYAQIQRGYLAVDQRAHYNDPMSSRPLPDPPF